MRRDNIAAHAWIKPCQRLEREQEAELQDGRCRTHTAMRNGQTKAAEREPSIIKAKTRTWDRGRRMRWE